eukprot:scaffold56241_cov36-Phaeocystis_antarctica.AAC.2
MKASSARCTHVPYKASRLNRRRSGLWRSLPRPRLLSHASAVGARASRGASGDVLAAALPP